MDNYEPEIQIQDQNQMARDNYTPSIAQIHTGMSAGIGASQSPPLSDGVGTPGLAGGRMSSEFGQIPNQQLHRQSNEYALQNHQQHQEQDVAQNYVDLQRDSQGSKQHTYYDSGVVNNSGPGAYMPKKSSLRNIKVAEDQFNTKNTEDLFYDLNNSSKMSMNNYFDNRPANQNFVQNLNMPSSAGNSKLQNYENRPVQPRFGNQIHPSVTQVVQSAEDRYFFDREQQRLAMEFQ